ncbi:MAG: pyrophosphate--fructose-6-phosphate 1-phosphotransferase [Candidatus Neomarinimicrobiota bacterium]|nr:pyrophosphate--fructose-6-phosphate 1-phosphotransferase [Candidatus Neomarinimicrobiota bacterium]MEC7854078.1 pyrophosphate--fructose-6-phosphate 1-phosphotransferase [Candidatus Neomarinimicrobiota bacterium]MEC7981673.1 pyrophosphate--fructose-6-phosphate 1-phosphotransferase [Candidatus Neomarinimicrobiota bacterium]|tara:strand:- start:459 stop:1649 length:1191 start_codon:yes stop_codon:yes gene_type:complete
MKIAFLTAGGIAPCLSASIGGLIENYNSLAPKAELVGYLNGYKGLLMGQKISFPDSVKSKTSIMDTFGGSPIGNSRVKLTNSKNCIEKGYIKEGENPLEIAAKQLMNDNINILHTIGGDDTNTMAAQLSFFLKENGYNLTVVGLPKTVDNDVFPIKQTLGAFTAAEQGAVFFENVSNENTTSSRQLIVHEIMGRNCGWLTAFTAKEYRDRLNNKEFLPEILIDQSRWDVDAVYIPEMDFDFNQECERLLEKMNEKDSVNIFLSEGAGTETIVRELESSGASIERDAFGHIALDTLNPGQWFAKQFTKMLKAEKTLVQKSGYFARSAAPNAKDLKLIKSSCRHACEMALSGNSGVVGLDDEKNNQMSLIDFKRIKGGKPFDINEEWFQAILSNIGQK